MVTHTQKNANLRTIENFAMGLNDYKNALIAKGYTELGSGAFGSTLESPDHKHVIKFFGDRAYLSYAEALLSSQTRSNSLPCVSKLTRYTGPAHREFFSVQMERLTPLRNRRNDALNYTRNGFDYEQLTVAMARYTANGDTKSRAFAALKPVEKKACRVVRKMRDSGSLHCSGWDLHSGNFMLRAKSDTIVITDPVA